MDLFNPFNLALAVIVIVFWGAVILLARSRLKGRTPVGLLILPLFFIVLGFSINRYYARYGTYAIAVIYVMMLPALMKVAKTRK